MWKKKLRGLTYRDGWSTITGARCTSGRKQLYCLICLYFFMLFDRLLASVLKMHRSNKIRSYLRGPCYSQFSNKVNI